MRMFGITCVGCHLAPDASERHVAVPTVGGPMSNYRAVMEVAWLVRDVDTMDDAIGVAVSEAGRRLNEADLQYVDIEVGLAECPACGEPFDAGFLAANTALVGLVLEMTVFNAESEEHAARIAKSEVGGALRNVPLEVIETIEEPEGEATDAPT